MNTTSRIALLLAVLSAGLVAQFPATDGNDGGTYAWEEQEPTDFSYDVVNGTNILFAGVHSVAGPFPLGFTFDYYGSAYTEVWVSSNGFISFSPLATTDAGPGGGPVFPNAVVGGAGGAPVVAPCWTDMNTSGAAGVAARYQTLGFSGNQRWVLDFNTTFQPVGIATGTAVFQLALFENDDSIEIRHLNTTYPMLGPSAGAPISIGFQQDVSAGLTIVSPTTAASAVAPTLNNLSWRIFPCAMPGTGEGLRLNFQVTTVTGSSSLYDCGIPALFGGETVSAMLTSKGNIHDFLPPLLIVQPFTTGNPAATPGAYPEIHLSVFQQSFFLDGAIGALPPGGITSTLTLPFFGLSGMSFRFQGFVFDPSATNGVLAATNATEFVGI